MLRKIIEIDREKCDACGICIPSCAEHALFIEDNELKIREDKLCDGLGACLNHCPKNALKIIEREADEFSHEAVEAFISQNTRKCASLEEMTFSQAENSADLQTNFQTSFKEEEQKNTRAQGLKNWPVKVMLTSNKSSFLEQANLCIAADCAGFACPSLHTRYVKDNVVLIACPRLENKEALVAKLAEIFLQSQSKKISLLRMEVPCCVLPELVEKALRQNNQLAQTQIEVHIIARDGKEQVPLFKINKQR